MLFDNNTINRILIIRLSAMGDIIMASVVIDAIRHHFPDAQIDWLVQPESKNLLEHNPKLNNIICWPRKEWSTAFKAKQFMVLLGKIREFSKLLKNQQYDLVIDLQGLLKSGFLAWLSGAPHRVAIESKETNRLLVNKIIQRPAHDTRMSSQYLHLLSTLDLDYDQAKMHIATDQSDLDFAAECLAQHKLNKKEFFVFCPFTTRPQKHWFDESWRSLAKQLDLPCIVLGGPSDVSHANSLCAGSGMINLTGMTKLSQAYAIIQQAKALVGVDTGLTHMGIAAQVPVVALFGSTCPYLQTPNPKAQIIYYHLECSPCRRKPTCNGEFTCMRNIAAEQVRDTLLELI